MLSIERAVAPLTALGLLVGSLAGCGGRAADPAARAPASTTIQTLAARASPSPIPAGVAATEATIAPQSFTSLAALAAAYGYPLLIPTPPAGWAATTMQLWRTRSPSGPGAVPQANFVTIRYADAAGHYLEAMQGTPVPVDGGLPYQVAPTEMKGRAAVLGQPAVWVRGVAIAAPHQTPVWQPGPLSLAWVPADWPVPGLASGYRLESDELGLQELLDIAGTVHR